MESEFPSQSDRPVQEFLIATEEKGKPSSSIWDFEQPPPVPTKVTRGTNVPSPTNFP